MGAEWNTQPVSATPVESQASVHRASEESVRPGSVECRQDATQSGGESSRESAEGNDKTWAEMGRYVTCRLDYSVH